MPAKIAFGIALCAAVIAGCGGGDDDSDYTDTIIMEEQVPFEDDPSGPPFILPPSLPTLPPFTCDPVDECDVDAGDDPDCPPHRCRQR